MSLFVMSSFPFPHPYLLLLLFFQADACAARQPSVATLYNFTSYANGIHGLEFSVVGHVRIVGFKVADNVVNGIEIQETLGSWGGPMIQV